jgi:hypothetical protein
MLVDLFDIHINVKRRFNFSRLPHFHQGSISAPEIADDVVQPLNHVYSEAVII